MTEVDEETAVMVWLIEEAGASKIDDRTWTVSIENLRNLAAKLTAHTRTKPN